MAQYQSKTAMFFLKVIPIIKTVQIDFCLEGFINGDAVFFSFEHDPVLFFFC